MNVISPVPNLFHSAGQDVHNELQLVLSPQPLVESDHLGENNNDIET